MRCSTYISVLFIPLALSQTPHFFSGYGQFADNCQTTDCTRCGTGLYKSGCTAANAGSCVACGALPTNAVWITDGGFTDSCKYNCRTSYSPVGITCVGNAVSVYYTTVEISLPLLKSEIEAKKGQIIASIATLSDCGVCGSTSVSPVLCERCIISVSIQQTSSRRLLASSSILFSIEQQVGSVSAETTKTRLSSAANIDTQLALNNVVVNSVISTPPATVALPARRDGVPAPPPASSTPESSSSNVGVIVGAVAGVVVLLVAASVTLCCLVGRKNPLKHKDDTELAKTPAPPAKSEFQSQRTRRMMRLDTITDMTMPAHAALVMAATNLVPRYPIHGVHRPPFQANPH
jgi:hypothetical protein